MGYSANIVDGVPEFNTTPTNNKADTKGTDSLGKDAFLQLLVAQMQSQDPLNPSSDTEYISQLAQFSSLEEMQNLNTAIDNSSAHNLVGKNVIMEVGKSTGATTTTTVAGYVQFVEIRDGKAYLGIGGETYSYEDLDTVIDEAYLDSILNSGEEV
ncbi:MAG: hypothetical protein E7270_02605 [Lachnospiraceae bacterium]|nr:hypothetical protein [Lachnospiraceae bacterium]